MVSDGDCQIRIAGLYRYPVKGLSPDPLKSARLSTGETFAYDRAYAIEAGSGKFDPAAPAHIAKVNFLMLMRDEILASLQTQFDETTQSLKVRQGGSTVLDARLETQDGKRAVEAFFTQFMPTPKADDARERSPRLVSAGDHSFSDVDAKVISVVNLESVRALEAAAGAPVDPMRFRANIYLEGVPAWAEMDWVERSLQTADGAVLTGTKITRRCEAINVDPRTGERDMTLTKVLPEAFGHSDCGIYMRVDRPGTISADETLLLQ